MRFNRGSGHVQMVTGDYEIDEATACEMLMLDREHLYLDISAKMEEEKEEEGEVNIYMYMCVR